MSETSHSQTRTNRSEAGAHKYRKREMSIVRPYHLFQKALSICSEFSPEIRAKKHKRMRHRDKRGAGHTLCELLRELFVIIDAERQWAHILALNAPVGAFRNHIHNRDRVM